MADEKDLTHVARTTIQWENARDKYEIIPEGVLCVEFLQSNITKIKIGDGHRYYSQLPYIGNGDLNEYYTKAETDERVLQIMLDNCSMRIKGELDSPTKLPSHAACGDVWFVKSTSESEPKNRYIEYVYSHEHKWEIIGGTPVDIDLSDYAKKEYVDTKISEVNARISSLDHHTHNNKTILDLITAFFTTEEKQKLKELHNYDDTELRELIEAATHTHTNKEILDKITAAYTKADKSKLDSLENYDDTVLKEKIIALEELAHEHLNKSILDRTSAAFTVEYEKKLKWIREYTGATDNDDGIMGMVPPAAAGEQDYVLNGAGEWVPMEGGSGIGDITAGTGIQVTKDSSGSTITVKKQYTTLEYVQSDKTQKIVTDLFFNESDAYDHAYIIELSFYDISTGANDEVFIGMGPYAKKDSWMLFDRGTTSSYNETSSWKYCLSDTGGNWTGTNSFRFPNSSDGLKVTRVEASSSNFNQTGDFWNSYSGYGFATGNPTTGPLTIFGAEDTNDVNGVCVIGYIKMIEKDVAGNESLLHHLVPVVDSNGTVGFIDKLTNKFYSTTTGTGLLSGPVTEEIIEVDTEVEVADENSKSYKVSLKPSTDDEIGGVKPGDGLTVDSDGILDVKYSSGLTINLDNELMVKLGEGLSFDDDGSIKVDGSPGGGGSGGGKVYYAGEAIKLTVETYTRLPEEYSELSYVENTSDSYTILDHIPTENTRVIATASSTDTYHDKVLFGVRTTSTSDNFQLWCGNESLKGGFLYGTNGWSSDLNDGYNISKYVSDGKTATFDCSLNGLYINNELIHTVTKKGEPGNWKMGLFAMTKNSTTVYDERRYYGKLYSFSIYESTTLVCELVPAYHKSSATPGLYDVVNDVFYSSITSTAFSFDTNEIDNPVVHTKDYINVKYGNGLTVNDNNELIPDLSDDLSIDDNGKITVNFPDETVYTQGTGIQISDGESGDKIISNLGVLEILESTNKNQFITKIIGEDGTVKEVEVDIDVDSGVSFTTGNGLTLSDENILSVKIGEGLSFDDDGNIKVDGSGGGSSGSYSAGEAIYFYNPGGEEIILPTGYKRIQYVETAGYQYIPTDYTPLKDDILEFDGIVLSGPTNYYGFVYGCRNKTTYCTNSHYLMINASGSSSIYYVRNGYGDPDYEKPLGDMIFDERLTIRSEVDKITLTTSETSVDYSVYAAQTDCVCPIYIFFCNFNDSGARYPSSSLHGMPAKLYEFKAYRGNEVLHDYIPAVRTSDNVPGVYDIITSTFYPQSTYYSGNLIVGPDYVYPKTQINVKYGDGLTVNGDNELIVNIGEGLAFDENGKLYNNGGTGDLPIATAETLGGVKIGTGIDVKDDGTISEGILRLTKEQYEARKGEIDDNTLFMIIDDFEESLPIASETTLGVVKIGEGISIDEDGTISADAGIAFTTGDGLELSDENVLSVKTGKGIGFDDDGNVMENILRLTKDQYEAQKGSISDNTLFMIIDDFEEEEPLYEIPIATKTTLGGVIIGDGISVDSTGKISVTEVTPYTLPIATTETLGGIMVGDSFIIDSENGTLNVLKLTKADYETQKGSISEGTLFVITDDYTEPIPTPPSATYVSDVTLKENDEGVIKVTKSDGTTNEIDIIESLSSLLMNCVPDDFNTD